MNCIEVLLELKRIADSGHRKRMAAFGIADSHALGVAVPKIRTLARQVGTDHKLAQELWKTEIHEARILAAMVADPQRATSFLLDRWAKESDSWDITDGLCSNLVRHSRYAHVKTREWTKRNEELVRRAGFALIAVLAVHDKETADSAFVSYLEIIRRHSTDERNFVKKAVNWALRQVGKRNATLNRRASELARELKDSNNKTARWIGSDALRELQSAGVQARLRSKRIKSSKL
jgi:3-methyladenine DNA glycosylase AlkD